ncbi:hypothetical protein SBD_5956 [Streptomyces bottropensis ATCC 25435]|uniref:Uncharacterized protein n=1 Tax=Streptomyces bottropensis ATCC 25435 TaxID=1054862 RepID=M3FIX3_9ACTN|nr:hypothetical protein SBD_5956 [Streptomyces bottropensis ATCC 25435]
MSFLLRRRGTEFAVCGFRVAVLINPSGNEPSGNHTCNWHRH